MSAASAGLATLPLHPGALRKRLDALRWRQQGFLAIQPQVAERLDVLSANLFGNILKEIERNLTYALREILDQDLRVVTQSEVKKGKMHVTFGMERGGQPEDILTGQGGSVCNVISVGLRLIALSQLDERQHRRFLVLDEQDCWLRPDLVPQLMTIIHTIAHKLQFQVLVISHHNVELFRHHADRIYRITPAPKGEAGVNLQTSSAQELL
jgi:DNA repair exonuclease SbcCD ATPase subunit